MNQYHTKSFIRPKYAAIVPESVYRLVLKILNFIATIARDRMTGRIESQQNEYRIGLRINE
jgi:hypothetical protein